MNYLKENGDECKGDWIVERDVPLTVWTDASSIATGVLLEVSGKVIEDGAWLRPKDDVKHINRSELLDIRARNQVSVKSVLNVTAAQ